MISVGLIAVIANLDPPQYLQALVVLSASGGGAAFTIPVLMACYWRRTTAAGMLAGMLVGFCFYFGLSAAGWIQNWASTATDSSSLARSVIQVLGPDPKIGVPGLFRPYYILGIDPMVWSLFVSAIAGVCTSLVTKPPSEEHVSRFFDVAVVK